MVSGSLRFRRADVCPFNRNVSLDVCDTLLLHRVGLPRTPTSDPTSFPKSHDLYLPTLAPHSLSTASHPYLRGVSRFKSLRQPTSRDSNSYELRYLTGFFPHPALVSDFSLASRLRLGPSGTGPHRRPKRERREPSFVFLLYETNRSLFVTQLISLFGSDPTESAGVRSLQCEV